MANAEAKQKLKALKTEPLVEKAPAAVPGVGPVLPIGAEAEQAFKILRAGFTVAPIIAGLDKYANLLTDWDQYVAPEIPKLLGTNSRTFMKLVGGVEVAAGVGVAVKPNIFGYVVSAWLTGIVANLLMRKRYYDVALRDLGLALGALALARLAQGNGRARSG